MPVPHWCYDDETEVLTEEGWRLFKDAGNLRVAQVNQESWTLEWVYPTARHESHFEGELVCFDSTISYAVTPNHRMLYRRRKKNGYHPWEIGEAGAVFGTYKQMRIHATLNQKGEGTYDEGLYLGFLLGDGDRTSSLKVRVRLKRPRKIAFLEGILTRLGKSYTRNTYAGVEEFSIEDQDTLLVHGNYKEVPSMICKSSDFIRGVFFGLMESDGSVKRNGWTFSSSSKKLFDGVAYLATLCGYSMRPARKRHTDNTKHATNYVGIVSSRGYGVVGKSEAQEEYRQYSGTVYCATVPTGLLMVRRNGKQMVGGNSPFAHPQIQFRIKVPIFVARQWTRSNIGTTRNEVSRRYVDEESELYIPEQNMWRSRPEKSIKQGSGDFMELGIPTYTKVKDALRRVVSAYNTLLQDGVAPEMARMVLPQNMYTTWIETGSLWYWYGFVRQRIDSHAQWEIQQYAQCIDLVLQDLFPNAWQTCMDREQKIKRKIIEEVLGSQKSVEQWIDENVTGPESLIDAMKVIAQSYAEED